MEATLDYVRRELGYQEDDLVYERISQRVFPWSFPNHQGRYANLAERLRQAMMRNLGMQVLIASGYYDLATPYFDADYTVAHMGLPEMEKKRVRTEYYESGHMMYIRREDHRKFRKDVAEFIRAAVGR